MCSNYFAVIEVLFYRFIRRILHSLTYGPFSSAEILRLHGTEPTHNFHRFLEFSRSQPLIPKTLRYNQ